MIFPVFAGGVTYQTSPENVCVCVCACVCVWFLPQARWEQLAAVMGHDSTGGFANAYGNQEEDADFTVPASDTPRV
jgi:hypothetical protein